MTICTDIIVDIRKRTHVMEILKFFFSRETRAMGVSFGMKNPSPNFAQKECIVVKQLTIGFTSIISKLGYKLCKNKKTAITGWLSWLLHSLAIS